jgi:hypothetical protein
VWQGGGLTGREDIDQEKKLRATEAVDASPFGFDTGPLVTALGLQARFPWSAGPGEPTDPLLRAGWRYLTENVVVLWKDRSFGSALAGILDKRLEKYRDEDLVSLIDFIAFLAAFCVQRRVSRETRDWMFTLGTRKTLKALREFPDRLRRMADEVEQVRRGLWFGGPYSENSSQERMFALLPGNMRTAAAHLDKVIRQLPSLLAKVAPAKRGHSEWVPYLSEIVKMFTGRYRDAEVSELLNAASVALSMDAQFNIQTLVDLRQRRKPTART